MRRGGRAHCLLWLLCAVPRWRVRRFGAWVVSLLAAAAVVMCVTSRRVLRVRGGMLLGLVTWGSGLAVWAAGCVVVRGTGRAAVVVGAGCSAWSRGRGQGGLGWCAAARFRRVCGGGRAVSVSAVGAWCGGGRWALRRAWCRWRAGWLAVCPGFFLGGVHDMGVYWWSVWGPRVACCGAASMCRVRVRVRALAWACGRRCLAAGWWGVHGRPDCAGACHGLRGLAGGGRLRVGGWCSISGSVRVLWGLAALTLGGVVWCTGRLFAVAWCWAVGVAFVRGSSGSVWAAAAGVHRLPVGHGS